MIAYKLFRVRADGSLGPLFINRRQRIKVDEWMDAEDHPTTGYAHRPGWHCTAQPAAAHLTMTGRVWFRCEVDDVRIFERPEHQGGNWILAGKLKVIEPAQPIFGRIALHGPEMA